MSKGLLYHLPAPPAGKTGWPWTEETNPEIYDKRPNWPRISIVTPSYNQGAFIEETIRSILLQNYPNLEYIIMDGGSTDETIAVIKKYEPWIHFWISEEDRGQSHAINKGIEKCTGDFFNWVNSDDYLFDRAFYKLMNHVLELNNDNSISMISGDVSVLDEKGALKRYPNELKNIFYRYMAGIAVHQPASLFSLKAVRLFGSINEALHYTMCLDTMLKVNLVGRGEYISEDVVVARLHPNSKSVASQHRFYTDRIKSYANFFGYFPVEYKNQALISLLNEITSEQFDTVNSIQIKQRFEKEHYWVSQLFIAKTIAQLYYSVGDNKNTNRILLFIKKQDGAFYRTNKLWLLRAKAGAIAIQARKIKNKLLR